MKTQANRLKISPFPKNLSLNYSTIREVQIVGSVSGDNLHYFITKTLTGNSININFERRDLHPNIAFTKI